MFGAVVAIAGGATGIATAQSVPGVTPPAGVPSVNVPNTKYTPTPASPDAAAAIGWRQVGGAVFPGVKSPGYTDSGAIPHTVDFFTIAFRNNDDGFAAGAACSDQATPDSGLDSCPRVPVIYQYSHWPQTTDAPIWHEVYRGTDATGDGHGFVGAIAWIPNEDAAVAVGGDGCYPRREQPCTANAPPTGAADPIAGGARAWAFRNSQWSPVTGMATTMTGMTALDFSPRPSDCGAQRECGLAGGLGQVWQWHDGRFQPDASYPPAGQPVVTELSPTEPRSVAAPFDSPFRLRSIRFAPGTPNADQTTAVAVTMGCCYHVHDPTTGADTGRDDPTVDWPRELEQTNGQWRVDGPFVNTGRNSLPNTPQTQSLDDSVYALSFTNVGSSAQQISIVAAPGGPQQQTEPGSRVIGPLQPGGSGSLSDASPLIGGGGPGQSDLVVELGNPQLAPVRLVAGDGDSLGSQPSALSEVDPLHFPDPSQAPDGIIDWAVGELTSTGQAIAYTTTTQSAGVNAPYPLNCPGGYGVQKVAASPTQCKPDTSAKELSPTYLFLLPSYPLNAYTATHTDVAWAAGDRGALLAQGGAGSASTATAPALPQLGSSQPQPLSNRDAYDAFRAPLSAVPGLVPPLATQPVRIVPNGRVIPGGAPNTNPVGLPDAQSVQSIAMSRDGSEGWAVGPSFFGGGRTTLYHYIGGRWTQCDPVGVPGVLPPDPACASLASVFAAGHSGASLQAVTRVPLENGSDPATANNFETAAVALMPDNSAEVLRYVNGAWTVPANWNNVSKRGDFGSRQGGIPVEAAFEGPDDGWLLFRPLNTYQALFHLTGGRWVDCNQGTTGDPHYAADCDDSANVLPTNPATSGQTSSNSGDAAPPENGSTGIHLMEFGGTTYLYGTRLQTPTNQQGILDTGAVEPVILRDDRAKGGWVADLDPKNNVPTGSGTLTGVLNSLSLARGPDGSTTGWGSGDFAPPGSAVVRLPIGLSNARHTPLLHRDPTTGHWLPDANPDPAAAEYLLPSTITHGTVGGGGQGQIFALAGPNGSGGALASSASTGQSVLLSRNAASGRFEPLPTPFSTIPTNGDAPQRANLEAIAPDNQGGLWLAVDNQWGCCSGAQFYRFTTRVNEDVFHDVPQPIREPISATAAGGDGSLWVATASGTTYRYDRVGGWDRVAIPGWDPARATVTSPAYAIAVGPDGSGLVVGKGGRIADISASQGILDPASVACRAQPDSCGGGYTLRAAAVAPDGSALVGGDGRTLLWRPPGGALTRQPPIPGSPSAAIVGIAMPSTDHAWLATNTGDVFSGSLSGGQWQWTLEDTNASGDLVTRDALGASQPLRAIAVDGTGHGYAVGGHGLVLERTPGAAQPWHRVLIGSGEDLDAVALGPGGQGALIGGGGGLVLTLDAGQFAVARQSDYYDPITAPGTSDRGLLGRTVGVALIPGYKAGDVEAWAAEQLPVDGAFNRSPAPGAILHYSSDLSEPLLDAGTTRVQPLPDAPARQAGELDFAAFGKSDCQVPGGEVCPEFTGSGLFNETVASRVRDALIATHPDFAVFTGDVNDTAGQRDTNLVDAPTDASLIHERFKELIADPMTRAGVPTYAAVGGQDVSNTQSCTPIVAHCVATHQTQTGLTFAWRQAFLAEPAPWGGAASPTAGGVSFAAVPDPEHGVEGPSASVCPSSASVAGESVSPQAPCGTPAVNAAGQSVGAQPLPPQSANAGGAHTHYAFDVERGGQKVLRVAVVDTSLKTVAAADGTQNPIESQVKWLADVLGQRPSGERAAVVSETPSYSYGPGDTTATLTDSATFEALMGQEHVDAVVSGRLGWNGLFYTSTLAPGLHCPQPSGAYPQSPCSPTSVGGSAQQQATDTAGQTAVQLAATLNGLGAPGAPQPGNALGAYPTVVAASAGGPFASDEPGPQSGPGSNVADLRSNAGYWHGYTLTRVEPNGAVVVEQRPVFDWIGINAVEHRLKPGQHMTLFGYGREPVGTDTPIQYDSINGPAITHRYDLVAADPAHPWLPKTDPASPYPNHYVPLDPSVGTIDGQTGAVHTGGGNHPRAYAIGILSVGGMAANWPIVFEPRNNYTPPPPVVIPALPAIPPIHVAAVAAAAPPPAPPALNPPQIGNPTFPALPGLPSLPSIASAPPPAPIPPTTPPPPPPPAFGGQAPLSLTVSLTQLGNPPSPVPPSAPVVNPAPPSGSAAKKEARQRQAATAKSEEGAVNPEDAQGRADPVDSPVGPPGSGMTRRDTGGSRYQMTAIRGGQQASAWTRDLLYGGGLAIAALVLSTGWGRMRPRPRRREPELPAPARVWDRSS